MLREQVNSAGRRLRRCWTTTDQRSGMRVGRTEEKVSRSAQPDVKFIKHENTWFTTQARAWIHNEVVRSRLLHRQARS